LGAERRELRKLEVRSDRSEVDLEVARLDDAAFLGVDADAVGIRDGVGDAVEGDLEIVPDVDDEEESISTILTSSLMRASSSLWRIRAAARRGA
jgi:hypothetical protein